MTARNVFIAQPETAEKFQALKAFMKALDIKFEVAEKSPYGPAFVEKIKKSKRQIAKGKSIRINKENIQEYLGL